jgi:hypothetical protein
VDSDPVAVYKDIQPELCLEGCIFLLLLNKYGIMLNSWFNFWSLFKIFIFQYLISINRENSRLFYGLPPLVVPLF